MNLNTKQQTMQYTTIPDGDGGGDDVVVRRPTPWWTGRSYSVLGGLILLLVAAAVVLQGGGGRPYDPAGSSADGLVLASITNLQNDAEDGCNPNPWCTGSGCC